jgi:hypothetical protein
MTPTAQHERHGHADRPGKLTKDDKEEILKKLTLVIVHSMISQITVISPVKTHKLTGDQTKF